LGENVASRACLGVHLRLGFLAALLLALVAAPLASASARQQSSIVVDYDTGEVLHAVEPDAPAFPASLTKMMTLYLVFEAIEAGRLTPETRLKVSARAAGMPPTKLGLRAGSTIRVEDAVMALVTKSANDMASTIAENLGGDEERFAEQMTRTARRIGMARTTFRNASGLPNPEQRTTARDLATLATRLITDHPRHYRVFSRRSFTYGSRKLGNHNRLLASYAGMDGIKTGYINASGFNLAASAVRDGRRVVAVVLGGGSAGSRDVHMSKLLDRAFVRLAKARPSPSRPTRPAPGLPEVEVAARQAPPAPLPAPAAAVVTAALAAGALTGASPASVPDPALLEVARLKATAAIAASRTAPAAKAAKPTVAAAKPGKRPNLAVAYGVRVGSHRSAAEARRAAQAALRLAPVALRGTFVSVHSAKQGKTVLFRGQLVGVDREEAEAACKQLRKRKQTCEIVRASPLTLASN
jgi:D-alanyl-D-alanine carboxypeptidase